MLAFEDIIFVMAMSICNVMMATMAKLAVEISESVSDILKEKQRSKIFCDKCSYGAKRVTVNTLFAVNILAGFGLLLYLLITLGDYGEYNMNLQHGLWTNEWAFNSKSGFVIETVWITLTVSLIFFYCCMVDTLNKSFS